MEIAIDESLKNPQPSQPVKEPQVTLPEEDNDINNKITELRNIRANMINNSSADINNNTLNNNLIYQYPLHFIHILFNLLFKQTRQININKIIDLFIIICA